MDTQKIISDLQSRAESVGLSESDLCRRADVAEITLKRWREGINSPTIRTLSRLSSAVESAEAEARKTS